MNARVVITGAGGFVCSHIAAALVDAGFHVLAVDRVFDPLVRWRFSQLAPGRLVLFEGDLAQLTGETADYLIHGAAVTAEPAERGENPLANFRSNLDPALSALEWAARTGIRLTAVISSGAVFGQPLDAPADEDTLTFPQTSLYAAAKNAVDDLVAVLRRRYGVNAVSFRFGNLYGPYERARATRPRVSRLAALISQALEEGQLSVNRAAAARDWTFAPDVGRAIAALLAAPSLGHPLYHVTSGQLITEMDMAEAIALHLPSVEIVPFEGERGRSSSLKGERLREVADFDAWTPLPVGVGMTIAASQRVSAVG
ncbi:MAG: NAD(P)-dependent oxidoreductase [Aggregatilineales bacterium]